MRGAMPTVPCCSGLASTASTVLSNRPDSNARRPGSSRPQLTRRATLRRPGWRCCAGRMPKPAATPRSLPDYISQRGNLLFSAIEIGSPVSRTTFGFDRRPEAARIGGHYDILLVIRRHVVVHELRLQVWTGLRGHAARVGMHRNIRHIIWWRLIMLGPDSAV